MPQSYSWYVAEQGYQVYDFVFSSKGCACSLFHTASQWEVTKSRQLTTRHFAKSLGRRRKGRSVFCVQMGSKLCSLDPDGASQGGLTPVSFLPDGWHCRGIPHINTGTPEPAGWVQGEKSQGACRNAKAVEGENTRGREVPSDCQENAGGGNVWPDPFLVPPLLKVSFQTVVQIS